MGVLRELYYLPFAAWRLIKGLAKLCVVLALAAFCVWVPWQAILLTWAGLNALKGWLL